MKRGDVCYGMLRAAACVDESDHHALMYVRHGQTVREHGVDERMSVIFLEYERLYGHVSCHELFT